MTEITYIWHDCFLLRTRSCNLLFDYWYDPISDEADRPSFLDSLDPEKPFYVFVSHFHKDHFNKVIFKWQNRFPRIRYIISRDVAKRIRYLLKPDSTYSGEKINPSRVTILQKGESYEDCILRINAFGSTDIGNSYAVDVFGVNGLCDSCKVTDLTIFHAGDLNCWAFRDTGTPAEVRAAENAFRSELRLIAENLPHIDIAFFPVDSRIGSGYYFGAAEFVRKIRVEHFFPMHFCLVNSEAGASAVSEADLEAERALRIADAVDFSKYRIDFGYYIPLTAPYQNYFL